MFAERAGRRNWGQFGLGFDLLPPEQFCVKLVDGAAKKGQNTDFQVTKLALTETTANPPLLAPSILSEAWYLPEF